MSGMLNRSPAEIMTQVLADLEVVLTVAAWGALPAVQRAAEWPCFIGDEPDMPDNCVTIFDTAGMARGGSQDTVIARGRGHGRTMIDGERQEMHAFQVRVRSTSHAEGYEKAREAAVALDERIYNTAARIGQHRYLIHNVTRVGDVNSLGRGKLSSERYLFTVNALASITQR